MQGGGLPGKREISADFLGEVRDKRDRQMEVRGKKERALCREGAAQVR